MTHDHGTDAGTAAAQARIAAAAPGASRATGAAAPVFGGAAGAWVALVGMFEDAAADARVTQGMGRAGVRVRLFALDRPDEAIVLDCREHRMTVLDDGPADVELGLANADVERLVEGRLRAAMAIATGRATYRGPVRRFLRVLPLVQAMVNPPVAMGTNVDEHDESMEVVR